MESILLFILFNILQHIAPGNFFFAYNFSFFDFEIQHMLFPDPYPLHLSNVILCIFWNAFFSKIIKDRYNEKLFR
jgi:hypothetical protein